LQKAGEPCPTFLGPGVLASHCENATDLDELGVRPELLDQALVAENALSGARGANHLDGLGAIISEGWERHGRFRLSFGHGFSLAHGARVRLKKDVNCRPDAAVRSYYVLTL
jgi:hypothetical protein